MIILYHGAQPLLMPGLHHPGLEQPSKPGCPSATHTVLDCPPQPLQARTTARQTHAYRCKCAGSLHPCMLAHMCTHTHIHSICLTRAHTHTHTHTHTCAHAHSSRIHTLATGPFLLQCCATCSSWPLTSAAWRSCGLRHCVSLRGPHPHRC